MKSECFPVPGSDLAKNMSSTIDAMTGGQVGQVIVSLFRSAVERRSQVIMDNESYDVSSGILYA